VLMWGQVLSGMKPTDPPVEGPKNHPTMALVWLRDYQGEGGKTSKICTTTMGAAVDLENEGLRRLLVNAAYWAAGLEGPDSGQGRCELRGRVQAELVWLRQVQAGA
jgi:hypothetical protein